MEGGTTSTYFTIHSLQNPQEFGITSEPIM